MMSGTLNSGSRSLSSLFWRPSAAAKEARIGLTLAAPAAILMIALIVAPVLSLISISMTDYELGAVESRWLGLSNYHRALADPVFRRAITNTLIYVGIVLPLGVFISLLVAILVHGRTKSRSFYEVVYFLPVTATIIAMAAVWQFILHPRLGPVNGALKALGFGEHAFLSDPALVLPTLAAIGLWSIIGFNMVLFLAGLSAIPRDLYDAASVDGATHPVDRFLCVTWPQLAPTTLFVAVTTTITSFKVFDTVAALTRGRDGTEVLLYAIYLEGFQYFKMGYAAALTVLFLLIILGFSLLQAFRFDRKVHY